MQGPDADDPVCTTRAAEPVEDGGIAGLRIAVAGGFFEANAGAEARESVGIGGAGVGGDAAGRAAGGGAGAGGGVCHHDGGGGEPASGPAAYAAAGFRPGGAGPADRGAMVPGAFYARAQRFRRWYRDQVLRLFEGVDAILAAATPVSAPLIGQASIEVAGRDGADAGLRWGC